jgi:hypothetical protein
VQHRAVASGVDLENGATAGVSGHRAGGVPAEQGCAVEIAVAPLNHGFDGICSVGAASKDIQGCQVPCGVDSKYRSASGYRPYLTGEISTVFRGSTSSKNVSGEVPAAIEGRDHVHSEYALLANVIVAAEGATFRDVPHFAGGIVPGDDIFTTWSYRAGAGRAEAFLFNPQPLTARIAREWGVVAEVVPNSKALTRARELAKLYLKAHEVTRRNTRVHFIQPLKERIVRESAMDCRLKEHLRLTW